MKKLLLIILLFCGINSFATTIWYVSNSGNDVTGDGTVGNPWATLYKASISVTLPNDIIHVMAGTYPESHKCLFSLKVNLEGEGISTHIILSYYDTTSVSSAALMFASGSEGTDGSAYIRNMWLDGNNSCSIGLLIRMRSNVITHDITFTNFIGSGLAINGKISNAPGYIPVIFAKHNDCYNLIFTDCADRTVSGGFGGSLGISGQDSMNVTNITFNQTGRSIGHNGDPFGAVQGYNKNIHISYSNFNKPLDEGTAQWNFCIEEWYDLGGWEIDHCNFNGGGNHIDIGVGNSRIGLLPYSFKIHDCNFTASVQQVGPLSGRQQSMAIQYEDSAANGYIYDNTFSNIATALQLTSSHASTENYHRIYFHNNLCKNMGFSSGSYGAFIINLNLSFGSLMDSVFIDNNTFSGGSSSSRCALYLNASTGNITNIYFRNNIVQNNITYGYLVFAGTHTINRVFSQSNILYLNSNSNAPYTTGSPTITNFTNTNTIINPLLAADYHLTASSPARGTGLNVGYGTDIGAFPYTTHSYPTANAGSDQTIRLPLDSVIMAGSGTSSDTTIASYLWSQVSGPSTGTITDASNPTTSITDLIQGTYIFQLLVTDNFGLTATDSMSVFVNAAYTPPVSHPGSNQTIGLPISYTTLNGSGTATGTTIVGYAWTQISGPNTAVMASPTTAVNPISSLVSGTYTFKLTVLDGHGLTGNANMTVTVNPLPTSGKWIKVGGKWKFIKG